MSSRSGEGGLMSGRGLCVQTSLSEFDSWLADGGVLVSSNTICDDDEGGELVT